MYPTYPPISNTPDRPQATSLDIGHTEALMPNIKFRSTYGKSSLCQNFAEFQNTMEKTADITIYAKKPDLQFTNKIRIRVSY